ncbi:hypothetical protein COOONC_25157, partial [Cooperia oncophora]
LTVDEDPVRSCSACSPAATYIADQHHCPDEFHCTAARIEKKLNVSSGCEQLTVECPGAEMQVLLEAGKYKTICPANVRCDGEWTLFDEDHKAQRIVNMMCLNRVPRLETKCSCWKPLHVQLCTGAICKETTAGFSPDGCIAQFPCDRGTHLKIARKGQVRIFFQEEKFIEATFQQ